MDTNMLKIFAGHMIVESELGQASKNQLLNYVQEASEYQVKAFLLDGEIMNIPDDIVCQEIIDERFNVSELPEKIDAFIEEWNNLWREQ